MTSPLRIVPPESTVSADSVLIHGAAAAGNIQVTTEAIKTLRLVLDGKNNAKRVLLRAAAGAGKSHALKRMVDEALQHKKCKRVGVTAFANKQIFPLARDLGESLGKERVWLYASKKVDVPDEVRKAATVVSKESDISKDAEVLIATSHMLGLRGRNLKSALGASGDGESLFDVLFIDEAWQMPLFLYRGIWSLAKVDVGVGDVGQLPPLDPGQNPWRGDRTYNPYRAWPTEYASGDKETWSRELPAVWRPTAEQLSLWRAFYTDWDSLNCVAASGDRQMQLGKMNGVAGVVWNQVATGVPALVELDGLDEADAPDIDNPLLAAVEDWLDKLCTAGFALKTRLYDAEGVPAKLVTRRCGDDPENPFIAVLATRNQAVDDATAMVERLMEKHSLPERTIVASTVDSWQGQTNGITVGVHPLSGASQLDDFNSAFGRLAVTCTRATHGLLLVSRYGLDDLLDVAPARPGTPFGEPGTRQLPRQTHQRILRTFARGRVAL